MAREYGVRPRDVLAAIGPSIGPCCFEVGEEVAKFFDGRYAQAVDRNPRPQALGRSVALQPDDLTAAGVDPGHIVIAGLCTACDAQTFYSHRRDRGHTGSMVAVLALQ
jgi:copper oxidase (laccase) domain-containing protein